MYQLRDYQQTAVDNAVKYFKRSRAPAVVVLPTGAGKSLIIAELARIAKGRVLVLAHVKELVEQNHEKYVSYGLSAGVFFSRLGKKERGGERDFRGGRAQAGGARGVFEELFSPLV